MDPARLDSLPQEPDDHRDLSRPQPDGLDRVGDCQDRFDLRPRVWISDSAGAIEKVSFEVGALVAPGVSIGHTSPFLRMGSCAG